MPQNVTSTVQAAHDNSPLVRIAELLAEAGASNQVKPVVQVLDYHSFMDALLQKEFKEELQRLESYMQTPEHFAEKFCTACIERNDNQNVFNFKEYPDSPSNKLYKEIAVLLFPEDPLSVLVPGLKKFYRTEIPEFIDFNENRVAATASNPEVISVKTGLAHYTPPVIAMSPKEINIDKLSNYAIVDSLVFDVESLKTLTLLSFHCNLHNFIRDKWPELADRIYTHNTGLRQLKAKIDFINMPKTPLQAINNLIGGLRSGGTSVTDKEFASLTAQHAYLFFLDYLKLLPRSTLDALYQLEGEKTFAAVLEHLNNNQCVEVAASQLSSILARNRNNPVLNKIVSNLNSNKSAQQRQFIQGIETLDFSRDYLGIQIIPMHWLDEIIADMKLVEDAEILSSLLLNLPNTIVNSLLQRLAGNKKIINKLLVSLHQNLFAAQLEKKQIIVTFVGDEILKLYALDTYLQVSASFGIDVFRYILQTNKNKINAEYKKKLIDTHLYKASYLGCIFEILLNPDEGKRLLLEHFVTFMSVKDVLQETMGRLNFSLHELRNVLDSKTGLHPLPQDPSLWEIAAYHNTQNFFNLLAAIPEQWRWLLISEKNTPRLVLILQNPVELLNLLMLLPEQGRDSAIKFLLDNFSTKIYVSVCLDIELFALFIPYYDKNICSEIIAKFTSISVNKLATMPQVVRALIQKFDPKERLELIKKLNNNNANILHLIGLKNSLALADLIDLLPEEDRLGALLLHSGIYGSVLGFAVSVPRMVRALFKNKNNWDLFYKFELYSKQSLILNICKNSPSLDALLAVIPAEERLTFILSRKYGKSHLVHELNIDQEDIDILFKYFPDEATRKILCQSCNKREENLFYKTLNKPASLKKMLAYCSLDLLKKRDKSGTTLVHHFMRYSEGLRILLSHFSEEEQRDLLQTADANNQRLIEYAIEHRYHSAVKLLCNIIPENERLSYLQNSNDHNGTILQKALCVDARMFAIIIDTVPPAQRLLAVLAKNEDSDNLFSWLSFNKLENKYSYRPWVISKEKDCLYHLIETLPNEDLPLLWQNLDMNTATNVLNDNKQLDEMLVRIPEPQRFDFLFANQEWGKALIHCLNLDASQLQKIIGALPEGDRQKISTIKDKDGKTLVHKMAGSVETLRILQPYFAHADCTIADNDGNTPFYYAAANPEAFTYLIDLLTPAEKNQLIKKENRLLHIQLISKLYKAPQCLEYFIQLIPKDQRLEFFKKNTWRGATIWEWAFNESYEAFTCEAFAVALQSLPEKDRLSALYRSGASGQLLIEDSTWYSTKYSYLSCIFRLLPAKDISTVWNQLVAHTSKWHAKFQRTYWESLYHGQVRELDSMFDALKQQHSLSDTFTSKWHYLKKQLDTESLLTKVQLINNILVLVYKNSNAKSVDEQKSNMKDFVGHLNAIPEMSAFTKKLCIALCLTVVGILPAVIIASVCRLSFFNLSNKVLEEVKEMAALVPVKA